MNENTHSGPPWEAAQTLYALKASGRKLRDTHQMLFDEQNFQPQHFESLVEMVETAEDAARVHRHPNCSKDIQRALEGRFDLSGLLPQPQ